MKTASSLPLVVFLFLALSTDADTHHSAPETRLEACEVVPPRPVQTRAVVKEATDTLHEALAAARRIARADDRVSALGHIAEAQAQAGDFQGATRCISQALTTARSVRDANARAGALGLIGQAQAMAGNARGATRSFSEALAIAREIADALQRASALSFIAQAQVQAAKNRSSTQYQGIRR